MDRKVTVNQPVDVPLSNGKRVRVMLKRDYVFKDVKPGDVRKVKEEYLNPR